MAHALDDRATWLTARAHARGHSLVQAAFEAAGSRPYQYRILLALLELGTVSQAAVGRAAGIDRSDVTTSLDALGARGFTTREPDPSDARRNLVSLTTSGRKELRRLDRVLDDAQTQFLAPLSARERETVVALLSRLAGGSETGS